MLDRPRFWWRAMSRGATSLNTWVGWFSSIVLLLGVAAGIAIPLVFRVSHWLTLVIIIFAVVVVVAEGSYLEWKDADIRRREVESALESTRAELGKARRELETAHRPVATVDPAEWIATCDDSGEFPNKAMVFNLRHRFQNMGARQAFGLLRCIVTDSDGIKVEATGTQSFYQYVDPIFPGSPPVRPGLYLFRWQGQKSNGEWVDITSGEHAVRGPSLFVEIVDPPRFENWKHIALIAALRVKITNTTGAMIHVSGIGFTYDPEGLPGLSTTLRRDEDLELDRELHNRRERQHYGIPLRNHATVPAGEFITGWVVEAVPRKAEGGTPACTVIINDELGNVYPASLPKREPQTYY